MSGRGQSVPGELFPTQVIRATMPGLVGAVRNDITAGWLLVVHSFSLTLASIVNILGKIAPGGSDVHLQLSYSINNGSTWATLTSQALTLSVGSHVTSTTGITWAIDTIPAGALLRLDVTQTDNGTASGLSFSLEE